MGADALLAVVGVHAGLGVFGLGELLFLVLLLLLGPAGALQTSFLLAALLVLLGLAGLLLGGDAGGLIVLLQQLGADQLLDHVHQILGDPVDGQTGGHGEADPQGHEGHGPQHGLVGALHLVVLGLGAVDLVGVHAHLHGQEGDDGGHQRQDGQADAAPAETVGPELPGGHAGQVDAQEAEVHGEDLRTGLAQGVLHALEDGGVVHGLGHIDLGIGAGVGDAGDTGHGVDHVLGHVHQVDQGLPDDGVQGDEQHQGDHGPQAAAHGVDMLPLIELLDLQIIALPVLAILLLQLLHLSGEHGGLDHALLALQGHREQNDLDDNGEQDQGQAVAVQKVIEKQQQPGKWH